MVCNNTFSSRAGEVKQIYFVHSILRSNNKKCAGIQNCIALKNTGFTPPPYYLSSTSTNTFDSDKREKAKKVARYYKNKERKTNVNERKPYRIKKRTFKEETSDSNYYAYNNSNGPKNVYVYKKKHLVQEMTFPQRVKTSLASLRRSDKKKYDVASDKKEKTKHKNKEEHRHKKQNKCKCSEHRSKTRKVEFNIMPNSRTKAKRFVVDHTLVRKPCKKRRCRNTSKTLESNKCVCKGDISDHSEQKGKNKTYKHKNVKALYHEVIKKVKFNVVPSKGNEVKDDTYGTYNGELINTILSGERCNEGLCAKAAKERDYKFTCKCIERKKKPDTNECINAICNVTSTSTVAKIRRKIILLCNKYSQILKERNILPFEEKRYDKQICDVGLCRTAYDSKKDKFTCKCVKKAKECTDASCGVEAKWKSCLKSYYKFFMKPHKNSLNDQPSSKSNAVDQTGEPFFELKVDSIGLSALNSKEIRDKVEALGNTYKRNTCICPSHKRANINFLQKAACSSGICKKAYKNKKTNFKCKCLANKGRICTDSTCEPDKKNISWSMNRNDPLLEVKFNAEDMSILNTEEIRNKISNLKAQLSGICPAGVCREAAKDKAKYTCKCSQKKLHLDIGECSDDICCKRRSKNGKSKKSRISCICARIMSKSETLTPEGNIPKKLEAHLDEALSKPECPQSDTFLEKHGLKIDSKGNNFLNQVYKYKHDNSRKGTGDLIVKDTLKNIHSVCDVHCSGNPVTCTCCKCMKNKHKNNILSRSSKTIRQTNIHKRNGLSIPSINKNEDATFFKCKHILSSSYSALLKTVESRRHKFKRNGLSIPLTISEIKKTRNKQINNKNNVSKCCKCGINTEDCKCKHSSKMIENQCNFGLPLPVMKKRYRKSVAKPTEVRDKMCMCYHTCECKLISDKEKLKKKKIKEKYSSSNWTNKLKQVRHKRRKDTKKNKNSTNLTIKRRKEYIKEQEQFRKELKKKEKADKKNKDKLLKLEKEELEAISRGREAEDTSCFADFFLGILKFFFFIVKGIVTIIFKIIFDPKGTFTYIKLKLLDPVGTFDRIKKIVSDAWRLKKLQMMKSISGSDKMSILSDTLQDTAIFQAFADKGKTPKEKRLIMQKNKQRKLRMEHRNTEAFRSCKHSLLHTLRKTPCLWIYHICPFFYPQCLGILSFMKQFTEILLFMVAFVVWTPCIACCETCRALCCCLLCTN